MSTTTKSDITDDGNGGGDLGGGVTDTEQKKVVLLIRFDDHETFIKMKSNRVLLRLMTFYCELKNLNFDNVVFLFDGLISLVTAHLLNMQDGDEIDAILCRGLD